MSDVNEGLYDVIFDDEALGEEESIDISRVILLANVRSGDTEEQCTDRKQVAMQHFELYTLLHDYCILYSLIYIILHNALILSRTFMLAEHLVL